MLKTDALLYFGSKTKLAQAAGIRLASLYSWNPTGKGITFFLKCLQVSFHLCDTTGDFFRAAAEVHPAQLIQLCLQMVYFAFTLVQLFLQGTVQRLLFGKETFQCIDIVRK